MLHNSSTRLDARRLPQELEQDCLELDCPELDCLELDCLELDCLELDCPELDCPELDCLEHLSQQTRDFRGSIKIQRGQTTRAVRHERDPNLLPSNLERIGMMVQFLGQHRHFDGERHAIGVTREGECTLEQAISHSPIGQARKSGLNFAIAKGIHG